MLSMLLVDVELRNVQGGCGSSCTFWVFLLFLAFLVSCIPQMETCLLAFLLSMHVESLCALLLLHSLNMIHAD